MSSAQKYSGHKWLLWAIVILYMAWIFSNSIQTGNASSSYSEKVARFLLFYVNKAGFSINFQRFHFYVRKLAHFSEYALLGLLTILALHHSPLFHSSRLTYTLFCLLPPFIDESIQLFTNGRSASLRDCAIDICGFLFGSLVMYILLLIIHDLINRHH